MLNRDNVQNDPVNAVDPLGLKCECKSFDVEFRGWTGWWGFLGSYTKRADVVLKLVLTEDSNKEDCLIDQLRLGQVSYGGKTNDYSQWTADGPVGNRYWWDGSSWWAGGNASWSGNTATFYNQPGFNRVSGADFPLTWGGIGEDKYFQFDTRVLDRRTGSVVAERNWGIMINYSSPNSGCCNFRH